MTEIYVLNHKQVKRHLMFKHKIAVIIVSCLLICSATTALILFGMVGYGRPKVSPQWTRTDVHIIYLAGKTWLNGLNAYDASIATKTLKGLCSPETYDFAYPPSSAILFMLLALMDLEDAKTAFDVVNILCMIILIYYSNLILSASIGNQFFLTDFRKSLLIAMIIGNAAVANVINMGQTSIIMSTFLLLAYYFYIQSNDIKSGIFLALALLKPQLSFTFFLWLLLGKKWKILTASFISTLLFSIVPFYVRGIDRTVMDWIHAIGKYLTQPQHLLRRLFGAKELLNDIGIQIHYPFIMLLISLLLVVIYHRHSTSTNNLNLIGILASIALLFGQAQQYDLVIAVTILPYFMARISETDYKSLLLLVISFLLFNLPRTEFLVKYGVTRHREIILLVLLLVMVIKQDKGSLKHQVMNKNAMS